MSDHNPISKDNPAESVAFLRNMIDQADLSTALLNTWLWLRALSQSSPPDRVYSVKELAALTGKSESTIYEHLRALKRHEEFQWEKAGRGRFRFRFKTAEKVPEEQTGNIPMTGLDQTTGPVDKRLTSNNPQFEQPFSENLEENFRNFGKMPSLNNDSFNLKEDLKREGKFRKNIIPKNRKAESFEFSKAMCGESPEAIYRSFTGRRPNRAQREELTKQVQDLGRWRETLSHWLTHGWNPTNIGGMLELYQRGGAEACRFCGNDKAGKNKPDPFEELLKQIKSKEAKDENRSRGG
jgi:hypothetical protein